MLFNDYQIETIRTALRAYKAYTYSPHGTGLTWLEVAAKIDAHTGVEMTPEVLRQFVEGVSKKANPLRRRVPSPANLEAIKSFLVQPEIDALHEDELKAFHFAYQAPHRMLQFLKQTFDRDPVRPPRALEGWYRVSRVFEGRVVHINLWLKIPADGDIIMVSEIADIEDAPSKSGPESSERAFEPDDDLDDNLDDGVYDGRVESHGWALLTPEDNLFFFMKELPYSRNHYYFALANAADLWSDAPVERISLLRHIYPYELDDPQASEQDVLKTIIRNVSGNTLLFTRSAARNY